jgi:sugar lactone lactonase YvrE
METIVEGLGFAEAPRWHQGWLWFVDYFKGAVFRARQGHEVERIIDVPGTPGGLGFLPDGTPLVVSQREFRIYAIRDGALELYADLSNHCVGAANEMFVEAHGRAWVGHHGFDFFGGAEPRPSTLLRVDPDGSVHVAADGLIFPNGTALLPDGRTLIVAESFANRLTAFTVGSDGMLTDRRVFAAIAPHTPDGIAVDAEGGVWAGSPLTGAFVRLKDGAITDRIAAAEGHWAVACAFGGERLERLALVHARTTLEGMPKGESEAFISVVEPAVPGLAA